LQGQHKSRERTLSERGSNPSLTMCDLCRHWGRLDVTAGVTRHGPILNIYDRKISSCWYLHRDSGIEIHVFLNDAITSEAETKIASL
jgi:hypothetical protein